MAKETITTQYNVGDFAVAVDMIRKAQRNLYYVANTTLIDLYWNLGKHISERVSAAGWGKSTVNELAKYIGENEPNVSGFSASNLWRMRQFYETYSANEKLATLVREIGWSNNLIILSRCKSYYELLMPDKKLLQQRVREIYEESLDLIEQDTDDDKND